LSQPVFSRSLLALFLSCAIALFAASTLLDGSGNDSMKADVSGPGTYSTSAVGYAGFYDLLRRFDIPAARSLGDAISDTGPRGTLVLAEPEFRYMQKISLESLSASRLLLVLPKWQWTTDIDKPAWISGAKLLPRFRPMEVFALISTTSETFDVVRTDWPEKWTMNETGISPAGAGVVQLTRYEEMRTIIGCDDGALVGEITDGDRKILVISDPDIMSNHGLMKGENAALMLSIIEPLTLQEGDSHARIVFDETIHGFREAGDSPFKTLFRLPFSIVTILGCCSAALLAFAGASRFGAPDPWRPVLDFGRAKLIDNSARLLDYGGHYAVVLNRYARMTVRSVALTLHAPVGLDEAALLDWLETIGRARGVSRSCAKILRAMDAGHDEAGENKKTTPLTALFEGAREIYRWKGEILIGSATDRRHT
jgi:hypothetical protein